MHRRWWLLSVLLCALLPSAAAASQNVHKCIAPGGTTTYQDSPCEDPLREAARWEAPIDPHPPAEPSTAAAPKRERDSSSSAVASRRAGTRMRNNGSASSIGTASRPSACEAAKAHRDSTLERVGLKRTYDLLSRLDEQVRRACR